MSTGLTVAGGSDGIDAPLPQLRVAAAGFGTTADDVRTVAAAVSALRLALPLGLAARVAPAAAGRAGTALAAAGEGPAGLAALADRVAELGRLLDRAVDRYEQADREHGRMHLLGILGSVGTLPNLLFGGLADLAVRRDLRAVLDDLYRADPDLVDSLMVAGLPLSRVTDPHLRDGHPVVGPAQRDPDLDRAGAPRTFTDLLSGLARRDSGREGEVSVQRLTAADGSTSWVVDVPGTKAWNLDESSHVTSLVTNIRGLVGRSTSYEKGVLEAMDRAGVGRDDPVMIVGHSEGGMIAVNAAASATRSGRFHVTHVVTAASPVGLTAPALPPSVDLLALENRSDAVPRLDLTDNVGRPNVVTATFDHDTGDLGANHGLRTAYLPAAGDLDRSTDPAIEAYRRGAAPFLGATSVSTAVYVVTRGY